MAVRRRAGATRRAGAVLAALAALGFASAPALGQPAGAAGARLTGTFSMSGRITVARHVRGERRGQKVHRSWTFTSSCATGQCQTVGLIRQRGGGTDALSLQLTSAGTYRGSGSFYAPLRCGRRRIAHGELVPFKIKVQITAAAVVYGTLVATQIHATYTNSHRINLTPCVKGPSHDAASYTGVVS